VLFLEPPQRAPRKPRPPTQGVLLDRMTRSMQRRLPISVAEGYKRPSEPVQAAKFASEAGVVVRDRVPILNHWKEYKKDANAPIFRDFIGKLGVSSSILFLCSLSYFNQSILPKDPANNMLPYYLIKNS
jgi:hypothetical protein